MIQKPTTIRVQAEDLSVNKATSPTTSVVTSTAVRTPHLANVFRHFSQFWEKRLLSSSCLFVCLSVHLSRWNYWSPTWKIFMKFYIW